MNTSSPGQQSVRSMHRAWLLVISIVAFAALMALRHELTSIWARAVVSSCAFIVLGWGVFMWRRPL